jgi:uncharacterized protein (TIGR00369 family)
MNKLPSGFQLYGQASPLTDPWEPIFCKTTDAGLYLGIWADTPHTNARGFIHGGLVAALADKCMGHSSHHLHDTATSMVTVTLSVDYLGIARKGSWIEFKPTVTKNGKTLCFAECLITADQKPTARATATFMVVG